MTEPHWLREVLSDLELFAKVNNLEPDLIEAISRANKIASHKYGTVPDKIHSCLYREIAESC
jgi:hypothetical protein